jgi:thiamine-phosphate pyrophosphorylase
VSRALPHTVLPPAALLVVSDGSGDPGRVRELAWAAAAGGAFGFQVREPRLGGGALARLAAELVALPVRIMVNDRVDVALAAGAWGAQLGERSLPLDRVRDWVGDRLRHGRSVHDEAGAAAASGADWLIFGHVFATPSKPGREPAGLKRLATVVAATDRPVIAIGGIDAGRARAVLARGARGVAVVGAVAAAKAPVAAVRDLIAALARQGEDGKNTGGAACGPFSDNHASTAASSGLVEISSKAIPSARWRNRA